MSLEESKITEKEISMNIELFKGIEKRVNEKIPLYNKEKEKAKKKKKRHLYYWMHISNRAYAIFRRDVSDYLGNTIQKDDVTQKQYFEIAGMKTNRVFIDVINVFEYMTESLRKNSSLLKKKLKDNNKPLVDLINSHITIEDTQEGRGQLEEIKEMISSRVKNQKQKRDVFKDLGLIEEDDFDFLKFCWDLRNAMHNNFIAHQKIKGCFINPENQERIEYSFRKGEPLGWGHPGHVVLVTDRIIKIMTDIIKKLERLEKSNQA